MLKILGPILAGGIGGLGTRPPGGRGHRGKGASPLFAGGGQQKPRKRVILARARMQPVALTGPMLKIGGRYVGRGPRPAGGLGTRRAGAGFLAQARAAAKKALQSKLGKQLKAEAKKRGLALARQQAARRGINLPF